MNELEYWIDKKTIDEMYSSDYWNDVENEKSKEWWIENEKDDKVLKYLEKSGLKKEFESTINSVELKGKVLDVAAGTCWTSALLSQKENISSIDSLDFSYHRINDLAPKTIMSLDGNLNKINRILGSFYDIKREDNYYDVIVLSQAYHHAEFPLKLFHECDRVLKKGGYILIIGEHVISKKRIFRRFIKNLLNMKLSVDLYKEFYNHDCPLGDHSYMLSDYKFTFYAYGYSLKMIKPNIRDSSVFIGEKR